MLADGDLAIVRPPPSKADPFGLRWGPNPIWLPYSRHAPINAARELAALEAFALLGATDAPPVRKETPVFRSARGDAIGKAAVDAHFKARIAAIVPEGTASRYSVHSFRIYLCTALAAAGASDTRIQAMLRWASEDALMLYKRADADEYGQWVAVAGVTTFDTLRTQHLPRAEAARDGSRAQGIRIDCDDLAAAALHDADVLLAEAMQEDRICG